MALMVGPLDPGTISPGRDCCVVPFSYRKFNCNFILNFSTKIAIFVLTHNVQFAFASSGICKKVTGGRKQGTTCWCFAMFHVLVIRTLGCSFPPK